MLCEHVYRYNEERNKDSQIEKREKLETSGETLC